MERALKQGPNRTVVLEVAPVARVVKRFHARGRLARLWDGRRAAREQRLLTELAARCLPVPEVLSRERCAGRWQIATRWIEGSVSLEQILSGAAPWPGEPLRLARRLGHLLGLAHARGVRQRDLHAANVLVDLAGEPWIVDPAGVRLGPVGVRAARLDLARACGFLRERTAPGFRARALCAWRRAAPAALRRALAPGARAVLELEQAGRRERRRALDLNARRWTRASGVLRAQRSAGVDWLVRRERGHDLPGTPALEGLRASARRRAWMDLGRLYEHGLPAAAPARAAPARGWTVELDGLEGFMPLAERAPGLDPRSRRRAARSLGGLLGALRERGFDPRAVELGALLIGPGSKLLLAPGFVPTPARSTGPGGIAAEGLRLGPTSQRERTLFVCGVRRALRGTRGERRAWLAELRAR